MIRRLRSACRGAALVGTLVLAAHVAAQSPKNSDVTCPYLRQQRTDRNDRPIADPEMGRDVIDNLRLLRQADNLLELAKDLAKDGFIMEAMECCNRAAELCPGSPCAARADDTMRQLTLGIDTPTRVAKKPKKRKAKKMVITPEQKAEWERIWFEEMPSRLTPEPMPRNGIFPNEEEPGTGLMVSGLMKACHLLMNQGMQHEAAELARQAYALDPQRVQADPLIYKMHLLAEVPATQPAGTIEESEPQTCPYCPNVGKPIREVVPEKKPPEVEYELEVNANASGLRMCADCSMNGNVYHVRFKNGLLTMWKTTDAGRTKP